MQTQMMLRDTVDEGFKDLEELATYCIRNGMIAPRGSTDAKIMIVTGSPSYTDLKTREILSGEGILTEVLKDNAVSENDVWFSSIIKKKIKGDKPSVKEIKEFSKYIEQEISLLKPKLIIALGDIALKFIYGGNIKYKDWVGMVIDTKFGKCIALPSIMLVDNIDPMAKLEFKQYFAIALEYVNDHVYDDWTYELVTDPRRNIDILKKYLKEGLRKASFDGEWIPGVWNENELLTDFQYAFEPNHAIVLDICGNEMVRENKELLGSLKLAFERSDIELLGWNAKADLKRLMHRGFVFHDSALKFDGMIATALINSRHGKGLDVGIYNYTNLPHYYVSLYQELKKHKEERQNMARMKLLNREVWLKYVSGDAIAHYQVNIAMMKVMDKFCCQKTIDYYYNVYLPSSWYMCDMEMTGIPIDVECMEKMTKLYTAAYDHLRAKMMEYAKSCGIEEYNPHYWQSSNNLLFNKLKLPAAFYTKKTKGKSRFWYAEQSDKSRRGYTPSTNSKGLGIMYWDLKHYVDAHPEDGEAKHKLEILKTHIDLNKINPIANKFLSKEGTLSEVPDEDSEDEASTEQDGKKTSYWNSLGLGNRIYSDIYPCLDNFRWSTKPNLQVAPAKVLPAINKIFAEIGPILAPSFPPDTCMLPESVRRCFWSGDKDWVFCEFDCLSADLAHVAYISKDETFLKDIREKSFHVEMCKRYFSDQAITKETDPEKIIQSKTMTFNSCYTSHFESAAYAIQALIYGETGKFFKATDLVKFLDNGWDQYPDYMRYKKSCEESVRSNFRIENSYGMTLSFEPTSDFTALASYINRALAWPVASSMALHMHEVAVGIRKYFKQQGEWNKWIYVVSQVHDAHYLIAHKDMLKDDYLKAVMFAYFSKLTPIATGDYVGVDMVFSDRWKGANVIWEGKSKWKNNTWVI